MIGTKASHRVPLTAIVIALCCGATVDAAPAKVAATNSLPVGRCINMGNHLETRKEGTAGRAIADDDFVIIAAAGFQTIRLPVRWSAHVGAAPAHAIDPAFMARVEHVVGKARAASLNVILNDHHFDALMTDPATNRDKLAMMWRQIAINFASQPREHLWFEIENEPHDKFNDSNLLETLSPALAAIRESNPDRPVIIGGEFWSGINSLATLKLPVDDHVVPTFHYYDPFEFTHQGATWVNPIPPMGRKYGGTADAAALAANVQKVRDYIARTGKTPFMGEFGANELVPADERIAYQRSIRVAFDDVGIGMCAWAYTNTFPLYDSAKKAWVPGMREAMGLVE